jgi:hypothetical protein
VRHAAGNLHTNRNRKHREAVQVIGGAVERINDPDSVGSRVTALAGLFGDDRMLGIVLLNDVDDSALGGTICLADVIVMAFDLDFEPFQLDQVSDQHGTCTARGHYRDIK